LSRDPRRVVDYLVHFVQAIERIQRYTEDMDEFTFSRDELIQDAVIRNLEIVGEACRNVERNYPDFAAAHPDLPLAFAYEMRNALAHGYFKIDLAIVWKTIATDLPDLYDQLRAILGEQSPAAR
jgi:uncharacterized protein with HEPN domain